MEALEKKEANLIALEAVMKANSEMAADIIKLNVRGRLFEVYKKHLLREEGNYFHSLVSSSTWKPRDDGKQVPDIHCDRIRLIG